MSSKENLSLEVGVFYDGEGVFLGEWSPMDMEGKSLGKTFNLFASSKDLPETATYDNTVMTVSGLDVYYGYSGSNFKERRDLVKAIKEKTYKGEWFLPTLDILAGYGYLASYEETMSKGSIYENREEGSLRNSFNVQKEGVFSSPSWYRTCSERKGDSSNGFYSLDFRTGEVGWDHKNNLKLSTRLVRAVLKI